MAKSLVRVLLLVFGVVLLGNELTLADSGFSTLLIGFVGGACLGLFVVLSPE